ncbi:DUF4190 domain-containing protein [Myroides pelagicus]|uniref:DUF4190 domain-containing protein n=1 Tax=Myroides pelagicus TaxID=270914 RepID=A0A7K1GKK1_9FLAO|nr:DUF4190 domain-containing protein [Myroides pelagicus]MTH28744.1 hypothetical protein [Myroides pelagicus]
MKENQFNNNERNITNQNNWTRNTQQPNQATPYNQTFEIIALVLGILGLITAFIPCISLIALLFVLPALILGIIAISRASKANAPRGMAIASVVISGIALLLCLLWGTIIGGFFSSLKNSEWQREGIQSTEYYEYEKEEEDTLNNSTSEDIETIWVEEDINTEENN